MHVVSGQVTTFSQEGAAAARFAFYDYLDNKQSDVSSYMWRMFPREYNLVFKNMPYEIWQRFSAVWVGSSAVYPFTVGGGPIHIHRHQVIK